MIPRAAPWVSASCKQFFTQRFYSYPSMILWNNYCITPAFCKPLTYEENKHTSILLYNACCIAFLPGVPNVSTFPALYNVDCLLFHAVGAGVFYFAQLRGKRRWHICRGAPRVAFRRDRRTPQEVSCRRLREGGMLIHVGTFQHLRFLLSGSSYRIHTYSPKWLHASLKQKYRAICLGRRSLSLFHNGFVLKTKSFRVFVWCGVANQLSMTASYCQKKRLGGLSTVEEQGADDSREFSSSHCEKKSPKGKPHYTVVVVSYRFRNRPGRGDALLRRRESATLVFSSFIFCWSISTERPS